MNIDDNTKRFLYFRLKWLGIYMGIGFLILYLLPFPYDFLSLLSLLVLVNYLRARRDIIKRHGGIGRIKGMFGSVSPPIADDRPEYRPLRYYCMDCGNEHKDITCPKCGSKKKRVG